MPFEERAAPPPALPDGSMPTYGGHALPGSAAGGPPLSPFGWGRDMSYFDQTVRTPTHTSRVLPFIAFLVLYGGIVSAMLAALAVQVY